MSKLLDLLPVGGHGFSWKRLVLLRRRQVEAFRAAQAEKLARYAVREDCRPGAALSCAQRYAKPSLLDRRFCEGAPLPDRLIAVLAAAWRGVIGTLAKRAGPIKPAPPDQVRAPRRHRRLRQGARL